MAGEPSFFEVGSRDAGRARAFYEQLFGWTFHRMEGDQAWIETPSPVRGGLHDEDPDPRIEVYFRVDDIAAAARRVRELGGAADDPDAETPGFGSFLRCTDDQGVAFGLHQPPA